MEPVRRRRGGYVVLRCARCGDERTGTVDNDPNLENFERDGGVDLFESARDPGPDLR
jgi:hypothetical protein